jgi:hypothetical protein
MQSARPALEAATTILARSRRDLDINNHQSDFRYSTTLLISVSVRRNVNTLL